MASNEGNLVFSCPHDNRADIKIIVGTKITELAVCKECANNVMQSRLPGILKMGVPFLIKLSSEGSSLVLNGVWEGMPRYLTTKEIGGVLKYLEMKPDPTSPDTEKDSDNFSAYLLQNVLTKESDP